MKFRTRLLYISSLTVAGAVALVTGAASVATRRAFERIDERRRSALVAQFQREMQTQGSQVEALVERAAATDDVKRIAAEAGRAEPDYAAFYTSAEKIAGEAGLDFLDVTQRNLLILSSAHWPARFGYANDWANCSPCDSTAPFLVRIPLPDGSASVALAAAKASGDVLVIGARRLDEAFLKSLGRAPGMRALLWLSPDRFIDADGPVAPSGGLKALVRQVAGKNTVSARVGNEAFIALPLSVSEPEALAGDGTLGVLLAGSSLEEQLALERAILWIGVWVGGSGIVLGILLGWWTTEKVTRPVEELARGARAVAGGDWSTQVRVTSSDEIGELAGAFNRMTLQLIEQRERALQAERVAAWRELARRLAHELKNPLFPLQITVENLRRSRTAPPGEFEEIFDESTATLLDEVRNLKTIVGQFADFARMPAPQFEHVNLEALLRIVIRLYAARMEASGIENTIAVDPQDLVIEADSEQLRRVLGNLVLNALDAMPNGGCLSVSAGLRDGFVRIEVSDTGEGLTEEEASRLFTPYYTTKQHGTGLGLAIVQSVVSDHRGKIFVESAPRKGAKFVIDLPVKQAAAAVEGAPA
jgi:two-component system nitrogen regulation sensor histidine kinase NtrY